MCVYILLMYVSIAGRAIRSFLCVHAYMPTIASHPVPPNNSHTTTPPFSLPSIQQLSALWAGVDKASPQQQSAKFSVGFETPLGAGGVGSSNIPGMSVYVWVGWEIGMSRGLSQGSIDRPTDRQTTTHRPSSDSIDLYNNRCDGGVWDGAREGAADAGRGRQRERQRPRRGGWDAIYLPPAHA